MLRGSARCLHRHPWAGRNSRQLCPACRCWTRRGRSLLTPSCSASGSKCSRSSSIAKPRRCSPGYRRTQRHRHKRYLWPPRYPGHPPPALSPGERNLPSVGEQHCANSIIHALLVGVTGFEPATSSSRTLAWALWGTRSQEDSRGVFAGQRPFSVWSRGLRSGGGGWRALEDHSGPDLRRGHHAAVCPIEAQRAPQSSRPRGACPEINLPMTTKMWRAPEPAARMTWRCRGSVRLGGSVWVSVLAGSDSNLPADVLWACLANDLSARSGRSPDTDRTGHVTY